MGDWCARELTAAPPPRAGSGGGALYAVLQGLHRYLARPACARKIFLPTSRCVSTSHHPTPPPPPDTGDLEHRIRLAYGKLAARPGDWVALADLRPLLGHADHVEVDAALRRLSRARKANLVPQANQKVLTQADREAAVRIGVEDCHLISIEE